MWNFVFLTIGVLFIGNTQGDFTAIFEPCCYQGVQWSTDSYRCDNYPAPVANISDQDQAACLSIIEVCCIKQSQVRSCDNGQQEALNSRLCAIRDTEPGAEQFRECCHCCQLGRVSRTADHTCQVPGLGEPCDTKFKECCTGQDTQSEDFAITGPITTKAPSIFIGTGIGGLPNGDENRVDEFTTGGGESGANDNSNNNINNVSNNSKNNSYDNTKVADCHHNNPCEQRCVEPIGGGVQCRCYPGYRLGPDNHACEDIDECAESLVKCAPSQTCINTQGRYTCMSSICPAGYDLNPTTGRCTPGLEVCAVGYEFNSRTSQCEDINECGLGVDSCGVGERCENTIGSYTCRRERHCGTGYTLDEETQSCIDNDECVLGTHNCGGGYKCKNVQGSFRCVPKPCEEGYLFDRVKGECQLIDCPVGLKANRAGNCIDINECSTLGTTACRRHQRCVNTRGSYYCRNYVNCPPGYEATENSGCEDVNECESGDHQCGVDQECINRQGTYFCQCPSGMRHDSSGSCVDVNECSYGAAICPSNSKCVNTIGSFTCDCVDGLVSDGNNHCTDVDECAQPGICQQSCINVIGTFFCSCNRGYQLRDDKRSCEDIDECTQFRGRDGRSGVCGGRCVNVPGSYRCECPDGWKLKPDGRSCVDIDECEESPNLCGHSESLCINTRGRFKCPIVRCPTGFIKTNGTAGQKNSIRCKRISTNCRECRRGLISRTFNFISFASNVIVPAPLFSMTGSRLVDKFYTWDLDLVSARPLSAGVEQTTMDNLSLEKSRDHARVTLVKRIEGPQDVVLKLSMNVTSYYKGFEGLAESLIYLYVTAPDNN